VHKQGEAAVLLLSRLKLGFYSAQYNSSFQSIIAFHKFPSVKDFLILLLFVFIDNKSIFCILIARGIVNPKSSKTAFRTSFPVVEFRLFKVLYKNHFVQTVVKLFLRKVSKIHSVFFDICCYPAAFLYLKCLICTAIRKNSVITHKAL